MGKRKGTYVPNTAGLAGAADLCHGGAHSHDERAFRGRYSGSMIAGPGQAPGCIASFWGRLGTGPHRGAGIILKSQTENDVDQSMIATGLPEVPSARLEQVDLRKVWSREAEGFTPSQANPDSPNLQGWTLGMTLEFEAVEKALGTFRCSDRILPGGSWLLCPELYIQLERTEAAERPCVKLLRVQQTKPGGRHGSFGYAAGRGATNPPRPGIGASPGSPTRCTIRRNESDLRPRQH